MVLRVFASSLALRVSLDVRLLSSRAKRWSAAVCSLLSRSALSVLNDSMLLIYGGQISFADDELATYQSRQAFGAG